VLSLLVTLGVTGVGWITIQIFPSLSHFEASLIALIASTGLFLIGYRFLTMAGFGLGPWDMEDLYEDEIEPESPAPHRRDKKSGARQSSKKKRR
jgi:hypothetical protein